MLEEYKSRVRAILFEMVEEAGLLGLANLLNSATINLDLSEEHRNKVETLHHEIMEAERITEIDNGD